MNQSEINIFNPRPTRLTMAEALAIFWEFHYKYTAQAKSKPHILRPLIVFFANRYVDEISEIDVRNFRRARETGTCGLKKAKPHSTNTHHGLITNLFNKLMKWKATGVVSGIDFSGLKLPVLNPGKEVKKFQEKGTMRKRIVTANEVARFLEHADEGILRIVLCERELLLRPSDLRKIQKSNYSPNTRTYFQWQSKTNRYKEFHVSDAVHRIFMESKNDYVLGDDFINLRKRWNRALINAKISVRFTLRDMRKTGGTKIYAETKDIMKAQEALGHAHAKMTDWYIVRENTQLREISEILSKKRVKFGDTVL